MKNEQEYDEQFAIFEPNINIGCNIYANEKLEKFKDINGKFKKINGNFETIKNMNHPPLEIEKLQEDDIMVQLRDDRGSVKIKCYIFDEYIRIDKYDGTVEMGLCALYDLLKTLVSEQHIKPNYKIILGDQLIGDKEFKEEFKEFVLEENFIVENLMTKLVELCV